MKVLKTLFNNFKNKFTKSKNDDNKINIEAKSVNIVDYVSDKTNTPTHEIMSKIDYSNIGEVEIINPNGTKTILTLDDIPYTSFLYYEDASKIKEKYQLDIYNTFKVVRCLGPNAGLLAYKYFVIDKNPVDYGILDITLGQRINVTGSWYMELDGIDIAKYLREINPNFKFVLCTAHTVNKTNYIINTYNKKCLKIFKQELDSFYLNKNSDRYINIYNLLNS